MSDTTARTSSDIASGAPAAWARSMNSWTASSVASGGTGQIVSPPTRKPSRLVARRRRPGQRRNRSSATSAAVVITCSQLSSRISRSRVPIISASRLGSGRSRADPIAAATPSGSPTCASSTRHAPCDRRADSSRATSSARRVLPTPPGPTSVMKRWSRNSRVSSRTSSSRPTNAVSDSGTVKRYPVDRADVASAGSRHVQRRVLGEDRGLQPPQLRARVEPELLTQDATTFLEDAQRVGLASGAIQRDHQQPTKPLAQRVRGDERFELADHDPMPPELQLEVEPLLDRGEAQFRDPGDLRRRELLVGELGERARLATTTRPQPGARSHARDHRLLLSRVLPRRAARSGAGRPPLAEPRAHSHHRGSRRGSPSRALGAASTRGPADRCAPRTRTPAPTTRRRADQPAPPDHTAAPTSPGAPAAWLR